MATANSLFVENLRSRATSAYSDLVSFAASATAPSSGTDDANNTSNNDSMSTMHGRPPKLRHIDLSGGNNESFRLTARIRTKKKGTVVAKCWPLGKWREGSATGGRGKCLFVDQDGYLCFDIGWVGCIDSRPVKVADGREHVVGVEFVVVDDDDETEVSDHNNYGNNDSNTDDKRTQQQQQQQHQQRRVGRYQLLVDGNRVGKPGLVPTPDHPQTSLYVGIRVGNGSRRERRLSKEFRGYVKDVTYESTLVQSPCRLLTGADDAVVEGESGRVHLLHRVPGTALQSSRPSVDVVVGTNAGPSEAEIDRAVLRGAALEVAGGAREFLKDCDEARRTLQRELKERRDRAELRAKDYRDTRHHVPWCACVQCKRIRSAIHAKRVNHTAHKYGSTYHWEKVWTNSSTCNSDCY